MTSMEEDMIESDEITWIINRRILGGAWPYNGPQPEKKEMVILRNRIAGALTRMATERDTLKEKYKTLSFQSGPISDMERNFPQEKRNESGICPTCAGNRRNCPLGIKHCKWV